MLSLKKYLLGISLAEIRSATRGFEVTDPEIINNIEKVGESFVAGYHTALIHNDLTALQEHLARIEPNFQGFAYEGAGMAVLKDALRASAHPMAVVWQ